MALEFIGGTLFTLLYDGVKQAMSKSGTFKSLLGDLKSTLDSLVKIERDIQQIGDHNVELSLPNEEIERLKMLMEEGVKLVEKLSNFRMWNDCCSCLNDYTEQVVELDRALKRLLENLKMQEARDVKELLVLARQSRDDMDELKRLVLELLQQRAGDVTESSGSGGNAETVREQSQGNGEQQVTSFNGGTSLQAVFVVLFDVVIEVKDKTMVFKPLLGDLKSTLDSLKPLIEEIAKHNKVLDRPKDELENFRNQMEKGVELIRKCSKVRLWSSCKQYKYRDKLMGLDESLQKLLNILKVQVARDVKETLVSVKNIEAVIKKIEGSGLVQDQIQTKGWGALPEPLSPRVGLDMQGTRDVKETLVSPRNTKAVVGKIEGSGVVQNEMDSASSFEVNSAPEKTPASPLRVPPRPRFSISPKLSRLGSVHLSLSQIAKATHNFSQSQQVGEGGFGTVYKARLDDGQVVSVKRAKKEHFKSLETEFSSEVELLAKVDHRNLVKLLGYVNEGNERLIITEYVPNGTLREHLDGQHGKILEFNQRLEIAIDVAHALTYLHLYAEKQIMHRDVKSSNILLTESMRAKVADFGFARLAVDSDQTHISTKVKGTVGYLDPEYMRTYELTPKSDVYSFGILLVEIITGRRPVELKRPVEERVALRWAFKKLNEGRVVELVDPALEEVVDAGVVVKIFDLAIQCAAPIRADRPDMKSVGEQLWTIRADYLRSVKKG